jgi:hypothetical protein
MPGLLKMGTRELVHMKQMPYDDRCWYTHRIEGSVSAEEAERLAKRVVELSRSKEQRWFPRSTLLQGFSILKTWVVETPAGALLITEEYHGIGD